MKKLATRQELTEALKFVLESLEYSYKLSHPEWKGEAGPWSAIGQARRVLGLPAKDWEKA